ncbi:Kinesin light chain [Purpureocillium lavendulum]|uniref:Kinesin light chain n=1 Tax=Purpureocillium lavendulum TaxID=1247861 RepID=A0AB34FJB2_9HYPO|nr:Kinesin light chain [Purpureocillium lavendulum]
MLPAKVPKARIIAYNYDSRWHSNAPKTRLQLCGEELAHSIQSFRNGFRNQPVVFLGHSLGGLVIQHALLYAESREEFSDLVQNTVGFISLGSPFRGTKMQKMADIAAQLMTLVGSQRSIIRDLAFDHETLRDKLQEFCQLCQRLSIPASCFFELYKTDYGKRYWVPGVFRDMVVEEESACVPGWDRFALQTDHVKMNKFSGPLDRSFIVVSNQIRAMCDNWKVQIEKRKCANRGHWLVPFGRNQDFVGRVSILEKLVEAVAPSASNNDCQWIVVEGLGGIGKSQIAVEAAFRIHEKHPECSVFWASAADAPSFENSYREIGRQLKIVGIDEPKTDVRRLVKRTLSQSSRDWILIVDNADDVELLFGRSGQLYDCLPFSYKGSILFTTRNHELAVKLGIYPRSIIRVVEMSTPEATAMILRSLNPEQQRDRQSIGELLGILTNLPLAIRQASAYLQKTGMEVAQYLNCCRSGNATFFELLSKEFGDRTRDIHARNPVASTWLISFRQISRDNQLAIQYLGCMSFLAERDIPGSLLNPGNDTLEGCEAIGTLRAFAFITKREGQPAYDMHRLVRLAMRSWLEEEGKTAAFATAVMQQLDKTFPTPEHENQAVWMKYLPHVSAALESEAYATDKLAVGNLFCKMASCHFLLGKYEAAEKTFRQALERMNRLRDVYHPSTLDCMNRLAAVIAKLGRLEEAESMHRRALEQQEKFLGPNDPQTLANKGNLAGVLFDLGRLEEVDSMVRDTLQRRIIVSGPTHPETLHCMNNLASICQHTGKYEEAEFMYQKTLERQEEVLRPDDPDILMSKNNLALVLWGLGKHDLAVSMLRWTIAARQRVLSSGHPDTLSSMCNLALLLGHLGKHEEAESIMRQTIEMGENNPGSDQRGTLYYQSTLAAMLADLNRYEEAESLYRQIVERQTAILGREHPDTLDSVNNLAAILEWQDRHELAEALLRETLREVGSEHPNAMTIMSNLALVLHDLGRHREAEAITVKIVGGPNMSQ